MHSPLKQLSKGYAKAMYKIGVIGDRDSVLGFMAVGFSVRTAENDVQASDALRELAGDGCAAVFITEELAQKIPSDIAKYKDKTLPAIVMIPSKDGSLGLGMSNIKKSVERAVGADILFKEN